MQAIVTEVASNLLLVHQQQRPRQHWQLLHAQHATHRRLKAMLAGKAKQYPSQKARTAALLQQQ